MKRYLVFAGHIYYAAGGWSDFQDCFDTFEEALTCYEKGIETNDYGWWQIVDTQEMQIIKQNEYPQT